MKQRWLPVLLPVVVALACGVAHAQESEDSIGAVQKSLNGLYKAVDGKAAEPKEGDFLALIDRCWKIYDQSAGEPEEFDALNEVVMLSAYVPGRSVKAEDHWRDAMSKLVKDFINDDRIVNLVVGIPAPQNMTKESEQFLKKIEATSTLPDVKAAIEWKKVSPLVSQHGDGQLNEAETKALIDSLQKLAADFANAKVPRYGITYKQWVAETIYRIEHLKIGAVAPEIEGPDLDGVKFKLSDYRGKVVMLDFWGYW